MTTVPRSTWLAAVLFGVCTANVPAEELKVGLAAVEITPPVGYRMSGYFFERPSTGVKDPLYAKAIYFEQGDVKAALVECDLIGIPLDISTRAKTEAERVLNLPKSNVSIMATHSHTGPLYSGVLRDHFHQQAVAANNGKDPREELDYPALLATRLLEALRQAQANAQPTTISTGTVDEPRLSFNRRFHMRDGSVRFNPGQQNPDIVRVAGPIDPQVGLIAFRGMDNTALRGALVVFPLHLDTVGGSEYSADYPKHLQDSLRTSFGDNFLSVFGAGTCGDINHVDVAVKTRRTAPEIGSMLAETVAKRLPELPPASPSLKVNTTTIEVPLQTITAEQFETAKTGLLSIGDSKIPFLTHVENCKTIEIAKRGAPAIGLEVRVFRLTSDTAIVTLPGEVFVELGLAIKAASPFKTTIVMELADDRPLYIPTAKAFREGSYETVNSVVQTGGGEKMAESAIKLLNDLK